MGSLGPPGPGSGTPAPSTFARCCRRYPLATCYRSALRLLPSTSWRNRTRSAGEQAATALRLAPHKVNFHLDRLGFAPRTSDAELLTLAVIQSLLGFTSEDRFLRHARKHLLGMFPTLPGQSGYNKRLRKLAATMSWLISELAAQTSVAGDDVWLVDSTPVECGRSRETQKRSDLAGWAEYGYCASHSRYFWGLRLHLVTTLHGLPLGWALTGAKADEREVFAHLLATTPALARSHRTRRPMTISDKNYFGRVFEAGLDAGGIELLRPARKGEQPRPGQRFFKPLRQTVESIFDTFKGQLDLERHGGKTVAGVCARIAQRVLALTAAIWHNDRIDAPVLRSLTAYDH